MTADAATTVVVPTYRRPESLARLLAGLARQDPPAGGWELVVVDNDPAGSARPVVVAAESGLAVPVRVVDEHRPGVSAAKNAGVAAAKGDVVAFVDDDVVPDPGWLRALVAPIDRGDADATGGRVLLDPTVPRPRWLSDPLAGYLAQFDRGDGEQELHGDEYVIGASCAFSAALLDRLGPFDSALGTSGGGPSFANEDLLMCRRVLATGARLRYVPGAVVVHELPPARLQLRYLLRRTYVQGRSDWRLDRDRFEAAPLRGAGDELRWLGGELRLRMREGPWHPATAAAAACNVTRAAGFVREAVLGPRAGRDTGSGHGTL